MVSSNKLIEHIAGGVMLGSFATYARQGCCNSGKRGQNNVDQQSITETTSGNLVFADDSNLPTEKQSPETQVREKIVNKYIYRDKPVERVVYQNKIIEKEIPLTGTIKFKNSKEKIWNADLLFNYVKLVEQVTGSKITEKSFYQENAELDIIYINHKNELNADIKFDKVKEYIENIRKAEIKIYNDFNDIFKSEGEKNENEKVVKDFMIKINSIIFHILLSTYEKTLMELFNYYEIKDEASGAIDKKRNICSCVNIKDRINSVYNEWKDLNFFSRTDIFFGECNSVIDLNEKLFKFYKKEDIKEKDLNLQNLSNTLKIENANGSYKVDEYGNKTKSIIYVLRYSTMQIFVDFVLGINKQILNKLSFLANNNVNSETLTLTIYANSTLKDLFLFKDKGRRKDSSMYTLIDKIIIENFNTLKRIYDDLCYIKNDMFGSVMVNNKSNIQCGSLDSLTKLYKTIDNRSSELCTYIKSNVFNIFVYGNNDLTRKTISSDPMEKLMNVNISQGSYLDLSRIEYITKIDYYDFNTSIDKS